MQYSTYFRGIQTTEVKEATAQGVLTFDIFERTCDKRPKQGFRTEGHDHTRLKGVKYATNIIDIEAELRKITRQRQILSDEKLAQELQEEALRPAVNKRGVPKQPRTATTKVKKAKIVIEITNIGAKIEPLCSLTVNNMSEETSVELAILLISTLFDKPVFRGRCKRTKAELYELIYEGLTFDEAAQVKDCVCKMLYKSS
jgi:hypothetical protein